MVNRKVHLGLNGTVEIRALCSNLISRLSTYLPKDEGTPTAQYNSAAVSQYARYLTSGGSARPMVINKVSTKSKTFYKNSISLVIHYISERTK
jgi:hypothetical protein